VAGTESGRGGRGFDAASPSRVLALVTAAYSVALVVRPKILAKPCGLTRPDGSVPRPIALLTRSIGVRDALLAVLLAGAPNDAGRRRLSAARVVADGTDAIVFGRMLTDRRTARKVAAVAAGWAALEAATAVFEASR
jgi:hypothetical protein